MWPNLQNLYLWKPDDTCMHFENPDFYISEFCVPKALLGSNINAVSQMAYELQGYIDR